MLGSVYTGGAWQMEMYYPDGVYRRDMQTDYDIVAEIKPDPTPVSMVMQEPTGIYNSEGDALYAYVNTRWLANNSFPEMLITNDENIDQEKYTRVKVLTQGQANLINKEE